MHVLGLVCTPHVRGHVRIWKWVLSLEMLILNIQFSLRRISSRNFTKSIRNIEAKILGFDWQYACRLHFLLCDDYCSSFCYGFRHHSTISFVRDGVIITGSIEYGSSVPPWTLIDNVLCCHDFFIKGLISRERDGK